jgi:hypothetical protein
MISKRFVKKLIERVSRNYRICPTRGRRRRNEDVIRQC